MRWPFDRRVDLGHAWGVVGLGTALLTGLPGLLATQHTEGRFRWWWPTDWMVLPLAIFVAGVLLLLVPVRRSAQRRSDMTVAVRDKAADGNGRERDSAQHRLALQAVATQICRLPDPDPYLCGRDGDVAQVVEAFHTAMTSGGPTLAILSGQPGVGTSTVAIEAARQLATDFPGGVLHVDLHGLVPGAQRDYRTVVRIVAEALQLDLGSGLLDDDQLVAALAAQLTGRQILLVLDNAADAAHVTRLVKPPVARRMIVTSRDRSQDYASPGLVFNIESLDRAAAIQVLAKFAKGRRYQSEQLGELARLCDDVPLALQMIGRRIAGRPPVPPDYLVQMLADEKTRLSNLKAGDTAVRAAIRLSYDHLGGPGVRRVFQLITAAPGSAGTAKEFAYCLNKPRRRQELRLNKLVDRSLARQEFICGPGGRLYALYSLFELVRLFARERLFREVPEPVIREFQRKSASYLRDRLRKILDKARDADHSAELDPARFHAAECLAEQCDWPDLAADLADGLHVLYLSRGEHDSASAAHDTLVSLHLRRGDYPQAVAACLRAADRLDRLGATPEAVPVTRRGGEIAIDHDLRVQAAEADFKLSNLLGKLEDWPSALEAGEQAASALANLDPPKARIPVLINNTVLALELEDPGKALLWGRKATTLADQVGTARQQASAALERGRAEGRAAHFSLAIDLSRRAGSLFEADNNWWNAAVAFGNGALYSRESENRTAMLDLLARAADMWERVNKDEGRVRLLVSLIDLGAARFTSGSFQQAKSAFQRADEIARTAAPGITQLMRLEAQLRKTGAQLFPDNPRETAKS